MERMVAALGLSQSDNRVGGGDSFVDRLSCSYTVLILAVFAALITTKQWLGEVPIACWCPAHFTGTHEDFTNNVCFTQNTYYLPLSQQNIPKGTKGKAYISYYQWVALALVCQAVLFYTPRVLWGMLNKKSGIAVSTITDAAVECQKKLDIESKGNVMKYMVKHMGRFLIDLSRSTMLSKNRFKSCFLTLYGNYLITSYIFIKVIYLINVVGQLFWLNIFLGTDYHAYGFRVLGRFLQGESWSTSERFPRVALCDFSIRMLGNIHNYTVQCSLPMNLFNEKIYIFVWFWFVFVSLATLGSLVVWIGVSANIRFQIRYVRTRLIVMDHIKSGNEKDVSRFVQKFLRRDGMFLIRIVAKNASDMVAAELLSGLWTLYIENKKKIEHVHDYTDTEILMTSDRHKIDDINESDSS